MSTATAQERSRFTLLATLIDELALTTGKTYDALQSLTLRTPPSRLGYFNTTVKAKEAVRELNTLTI